MATLTNPQLSGAVVATLTGSAGSSNTTTNVNHASASTPVVGSGAGQVNKIYDSAFTIVDNATPTTIDLSNVADPQGNALSFSVVNAIKITNNSIVAGQDITPFGGTNGLLATSTVKVLAGTTPGSLTLDFGTTGVTVDGTHKIIQLALAAGAGVTGKITVLGR